MRGILLFNILIGYGLYFTTLAFDQSEIDSFLNAVSHIYVVIYCGFGYKSVSFPHWYYECIIHCWVQYWIILYEYKAMKTISRCASRVGYTSCSTSPVESVLFSTMPIMTSLFHTTIFWLFDWNTCIIQIQKELIRIPWPWKWKR
jgi:hypothetical protein